MIEQALQNLYTYCRENEWQGWDPYDGLNSRIFRALPLKYSRLCRLAWIQLFKRSRINLRGVALVPREQNPKGLALFGRGLMRLKKAGIDWVEAEDLPNVMDRLEALRSPGFEPWCWGYNFDWQGRAFFLERFKPNAVATTFAAHAFLDRYEMEANPADLEKGRSACDFVLSHLNRPHESNDRVGFSYTPFDQTVVHNINLLIAAMLARVAALGDEAALGDWARRAVAFTLAHQAEDGSWAYGEAHYQGWVDHFHTCYNLLALDECRLHLKTDAYDDAISRGLAYYLDHLFREDSLPRPDTRGDYPIDIHAVALALMTLEHFGEIDARCRERQEKIVEWAVDEMQDRRGFFYYQKRAPHIVVRIPYMRWAQAWMFHALSLLVTPSGRES